MATHAPITGAPLRAPIDLARFDRERLADLITAAIDILDQTDGDPDLEPNGDELDGNPAEDDFWPHSVAMSGPGCPIADPDLAADDGPCDGDGGDREDVPNAMEWEDPSTPPPGARKSLETHRRRIRETRYFTSYGRDMNGRRFVRRRWLYQEPTIPTLRTFRRRYPALRGKRAIRR